MSCCSNYKNLCGYDCMHCTCDDPFPPPCPEPFPKEESYVCAPDSCGSNRCVKVNFPPGNDRFSTMQECQSCCANEGSFSCINGKCVHTMDPIGPGRFSSMEECRYYCCPLPPIPPKRCPQHPHKPPPPQPRPRPCPCPIPHPPPCPHPPPPHPPMPPHDPPVPPPPGPPPPPPGPPPPGPTQAASSYGSYSNEEFFGVI